MGATLGLVVVAGGASTRYGKENKLFAKLDGKPLFLHCLERLLPAVGVSNAVLVVPKEADADFRAQLPDWMVELRLVFGGAERSASALAGIQALPQTVDYVGIQDAARPFSTGELLRACFQEAVRFGGAIAAHRVTDTIKVASPDGFIQKTPERSTLWAAETPQVFRRDWITEAYEICIQNKCSVTDDAQAVQLLGHPIRLVENHACNLKITYPEELELAQHLIGEKQ